MFENMSEKVSVNINSATLSQIDLLVDNGYYSNRSDFINQALRESLKEQRGTIERIERQQHGKDPWFLGMMSLSQSALEKDYLDGRSYILTGYGVLVISESIPREILYSVIKSLHIRGKIVAPGDIKEHYCITKKSEAT